MLLKHGGIVGKKQKRQNCLHEYEYLKQVFVFKNGGKSFHYKEKCVKCGQSKFVQRTKEIYQLVKDKSWITSKKSRQRLIQAKLN